jgi:hypothetical protein
MLEKFIDECKGDTDLAAVDLKVTEFCRQHQITLVQTQTPVSQLQLLQGYFYYLKALDYRETEFSDSQNEYRKAISEASEAACLKYSDKSEEYISTEISAAKKREEAARKAFLDVRTKLCNIFEQGIVEKNIHCLLAKITEIVGFELDDISIGEIDERLQQVKVEVGRAEKVFGPNVNFMCGLWYAAIADQIQHKHKSQLEITQLFEEKIGAKDLPRFFGFSYYTYQREQLEQTRTLWKEDTLFCLNEAKRLLGADFDKGETFSAILNDLAAYSKLCGAEGLALEEAKGAIAEILPELQKQIDSVKSDSVFSMDFLYSLFNRLTTYLGSLYSPQAEENSTSASRKLA